MYNTKANKANSKGPAINGTGLKGLCNLNGLGVRLERKACKGGAVRPLSCQIYHEYQGRSISLSIDIIGDYGELVVGVRTICSWVELHCWCS